MAEKLYRTSSFAWVIRMRECWMVRMKITVIANDGSVRENDLVGREGVGKLTQRHIDA